MCRCRHRHPVCLCTATLATQWYSRTKLVPGYIPAWLLQKTSRRGRYTVLSADSDCGPSVEILYAAEKVAPRHFAGLSTRLSYPSSQRPPLYRCTQHAELLDALCNSASRCKVRMTSIVDLPAVNPDCCRRLGFVNKGWILDKSTWAKTLCGIESSEIGW